MRDHGIAQAERIVQEAEKETGLEEGLWVSMNKGDWRKGLVAGLIRSRVLMDNGWLAQRLSMGARNAVGRTIRAAKGQAGTDWAAGLE